MATIFSCWECAARTRGVMSCLTYRQAQQLTAGRLTLAFDRGQVLFAEGDPSRVAYCINGGCVRLSRLGPAGERVFLGDRRSGHLLGLASVLAGEPYARTAEAVERTSVCSIPRETLLDLIRQNSALGLDLCRLVAEQSLASEVELLSRTVGRVQQRTARMLTGLMRERKPHAADGGTLVVVASRAEMALSVGTARETLSRTLHAFAEQGILELAGPRLVRVLDPLRLRRLAGEAEAETAD